uniref:Uncharacterized protein n=1 Tax=Aegilops tauschii subsp. strangulata TaxID=200361 RepID=A0A453A3K4_AEGTS
GARARVVFFTLPSTQLKRINPATAVLYQVAGEEPCESLKQVRTLEASKSSVDQQVWCWEEPFVIR